MAKVRVTLEIDDDDPMTLALDAGPEGQFEQHDAWCLSEWVRESLVSNWKADGVYIGVTV